MTGYAFTLFDTPIGSCGIAWGQRGLVCVQLPEARAAETRARVRERVPEAREAAPPADVRWAIAAISALLRGEASELGAVALDMQDVPPFHRRVYEVARTIPRGATLSYGEVAARLDAPGAARAVGQALGRNPFAIVVPCHRVLAAGGKVGGFSASGGTQAKLRMLAIEGAGPAAAPPLFGGDGELGFDPKVALSHLRAVDEPLGRVIDAVGPFRMQLQKTVSVFGALAEAIVYQQLSGKAAATIFGRVSALFPEALGPAQILKASDEKLRGAGLSRPKLLSLRDLARRTEAGQIPSLAELGRLEDEAIIERLTEVRGIGRWTAEMFLMFRLGRPDVLPVADYGIRKGFALAFKKRALPEQEQLHKRGAKWKPYRTVASWYLWRALELDKK